jgi:flotillin
MHIRPKSTLKHPVSSSFPVIYFTATQLTLLDIAATQEAESRLFHQGKEAEGLTKIADAYLQMAKALGGPAGLLQYMMIEKGTYIALAHANADAVRGMQPKVTVWNTGSNADGGNDPMAAIRNMYQMLPPLMSTINEQTGITLPEWPFGRMAGNLSGKEGGVNGIGLG